MSSVFQGGEYWRLPGVKWTVRSANLASGGLESDSGDGGSLSSSSSFSSYSRPSWWDDSLYSVKGPGALTSEAVSFIGSFRETSVGRDLLDAARASGDPLGIYIGDGTGNSYTMWNWNSSVVSYGGGGNDYLAGGSRDDALYGGDDDDVLEGRGGDDFLDGGSGDDVLHGRADDDHLVGGSGDDRLIGDEGDDVLEGGSGVDVLHGGAGNDSLKGGEGGDVFLFRDSFGHDVIEDFDPSDGDRLVIRGGTLLLDLGTSVLTAEGVEISYSYVDADGDGRRDDTRMTVTGAHSGTIDLLNVAHETSGDGSVRMVRSDGDWYRFFGPRASSSFAPFSFAAFESESFSGEYRVFVESRGVVLPVYAGSSGDDDYDATRGDAGWSASIPLMAFGGSGDDRFVGGLSADVLYGGSGSDRLYGGLGSDRLFGDSGDDSIEGGLGNDFLDGGSGDDTLLGGSGDDQVRGGSGADWLSGYYGDDILYGDDGDDTLVGGFGDDSLGGGGGDDRLEGGYGDDSLYGEMGDDVLSGDGGDDTLDGGIGDDVLRGGSGDDSLFGGSGDDSLSGDSGGDSLRGDSGDDVLSGGFGDDSLDGGLGDDVLRGDSGDDWLSGGVGDDSLDGGYGNDSLRGGAGGDTFAFSGSFGRDVVEDFDPLSDRLVVSASSVSVSRSGSGSLSGSLSAVDGVEISYERVDADGDGWRDDTRLRVSGSAVGTIDLLNVVHVEGDDGSVSLSRVSEEGIDGLYRFIGPGVSTRHSDSGFASWFESFKSSAAGASYVDAAHSSGKGYGEPIYLGSRYGDIRILGDGDGVEYDAFQLAVSRSVDARYVYSGDGNDGIYGSSEDDVVYGGAGRDLLRGRGGDDTLEGGSGNDRVYGGAGDDSIDGGSGNDRLYGEQVYERDLVFDGDNPSGSDTIRGGDGDDVIAGEFAQATRFYRSLDGVSEISPHSIRYLGPQEYSIRQASRYEVRGGGDDVLHGDAGNDTLYGELAWGDVVDGGDDSLYGGDGDDWLYGEFSIGKVLDPTPRNVIRGGDDYLEGGSGGDMFRFLYDFGHDTIGDFDASEGDRIAIHSPQIIYVYYETSVRSSSLMVEDGSQVAFSRVDSDGDGRRDDTRLTVTGEHHGTIDLLNVIEEGGSLRRIEDDESLPGPVERYRFAGPGAESRESDSGFVSWFGSFRSSPDDAAYHAVTASRGGVPSAIHVGTAGNDSLDLSGGLGGLGDYVAFASLGDDVVTGGVEDDLLYGGAGNDVLSGGVGNDRLHGGSGNDRLEGGSGVDTLYGGSGDDVLLGGLSGDVLDGGEGDDTVSYADAMCRVAVNLHTGAAYYGASGDVFRSVEHLHGSAFGDILAGDGGDNTLAGLGGNDIFSGGGGDDVIYGDAPTASGGTVHGDDVLHGDYSALTMTRETSGDDELHGGGGDDVLSGETAVRGAVIAMGGDDTLYGGSGNDVLYGERATGSVLGGGDDALYGGSGDDWLYGEALEIPSSGFVTGVIRDGGDDRLEGGSGSDVFVFSGGFGHDVVTDYDVSEDRLAVSGSMSMSATRLRLSASSDSAWFDEGISVSYEVLDVDGDGRSDDLRLRVDGSSAYGTIDLLNNVLVKGEIVSVSDDETIPSSFDPSDLPTPPPSAPRPSSSVRNHIDETSSRVPLLREVQCAPSGSHVIRSVVSGSLPEGFAAAGLKYVQGGSSVGDEIYSYVLDEESGALLFVDRESGRARFVGGDGDDVMVGGASHSGGSGDDVFLFGANFKGETYVGNAIPITRVKYAVEGGSGYDVGIYTGFGGVGSLHEDGEEEEGSQGLFSRGYRLEDVYFELGDHGLEGFYGGCGTDLISAFGVLDGSLLHGRRGDDVLRGGSGDDTLIGGGGNDYLRGGEGDDRLLGRRGDDYLRGGDGGDYLAGGSGDDTLSGDDGNDVLRGGSGRDHLMGGRGDDYLAGGRDDDRLEGSFGNDTLSGGSGDDTLSGGSGDDHLTGGSGADQFKFALDTRDGGGSNTIYDFNPDEGDRVRVLGWDKFVRAMDGTRSPSDDFGKFEDSLTDIDGGAQFTFGNFVDPETGEVSSRPLSVLLGGVHSSELSEDDFSFI